MVRLATGAAMAAVLVLFYRIVRENERLYEDSVIWYARYHELERNIQRPLIPE